MLKGDDAFLDRIWERFPLARLPWPVEFVIVSVAVGAATLLRLTLDTSLPPGFPFLTFFPVVILSAFLLGARAGITSMILAGAAAWYLFLPPTRSIRLSAAGYLAMGFYFFITATEILLVHWMQRANRSLVFEREEKARLATSRALLFQELQHRVANNLQMIGALLSLQRHHVEDAGAKNALHNAAQRLGVVGRISRQIYSLDGEERPLVPFLRQLVSDVIAANGGLTVTWSVDGDDALRVGPDQSVPLALIVSEAVANAIEHGFASKTEGCRIEVAVNIMREAFLIEIKDNGRGLSSDFDEAKHADLGLKISSLMAQQIDGAFTLRSGDAGGTIASVSLPISVLSRPN